MSFNKAKACFINIQFIDHLCKIIFIKGCGPLFQDHVYIYDGIPKFIDNSGNGVLLGAFCGFYVRQFRSVMAKSGIVTIYFNADISGDCK